MTTGIDFIFQEFYRNSVFRSQRMTRFNTMVRILKVLKNTEPCIDIRRFIFNKNAQSIEKKVKIQTRVIAFRRIVTDSNNI